MPEEKDKNKAENESPNWEEIFFNKLKSYQLS
jgi:hypothetical protein